MPASDRNSAPQFTTLPIDYTFNNDTFSESKANDAKFAELFKSSVEYNKLKRNLEAMYFSARKSISPLKKELSKYKTLIASLVPANVDATAKAVGFTFSAVAKTQELKVSHLKKELNSRKERTQKELDANTKIQVKHNALKAELDALEKTQRKERREAFGEWFDKIKTSYSELSEEELSKYPVPSRGNVNYDYARSKLSDFDEATRIIYKVLLERKELSSLEYKTSYTHEIVKLYSIKFAQAITDSVDRNFSRRSSDISASNAEEGGVKRISPVVIEDVDFQNISFSTEDKILSGLFNTDLVNDISHPVSGAASVRQLVKRYDEEVSGPSPRKGEAYIKIYKFISQYFVNTLVNVPRYTESIVFEKTLTCLIENFIVRFSECCMSVLNRFGGVTMQSRVIHAILEPRYISGGISYEEAEKEIESLWTQPITQKRAKK